MRLILLGILMGVCYCAGGTFRNPEDIMTVRKKCMEENNVAPELLVKYKNFEFPDDPITRCYVRCILVKFDIYDEKDGFKTAALLAQLGHGNEVHDEVKASVEKCTGKNDAQADSCTLAYRGFQCFMDKHLPLVMQSMKKA